MYYIFFIHSSVDGHSDCFQVLSTVNSVAMNIRVQASFQIMIFSGYMPRSKIDVGFSIFSFLRNLHTFLHSPPSSLICGVGGALQSDHNLRLSIAT